MRYQPHTADDIQEMLEAIGAGSIEELFHSIPEKFRLDRPLDLPEALDEQHLIGHLKHLAALNKTHHMTSSFLGAGLYEHYTPQVVDQMILRSEYLTAYTPYQPELAQGTLKAIFEFQTMIAEILDMDLANASVYDGAHATAEAALMGLRIRRKAKRVFLSEGIHPEYLAVANTYLGHMDDVVRTVPLVDGRTDYDAIPEEDLKEGAILLVQSPNFFGVVEDVARAETVAHAQGCLLGVVTSEPIAYGLLQPPGALGADIAVGEGQPLGIPVGFGGPLLGILACKKEYMRSTPGRLVSRTVDIEGRDSYVLTLATREQHIRRARATSNICTNQGLMALTATIYLSLLGREGYQELARLIFARTEYAKKKLSQVPGVSLEFAHPTFNEFTVRLPGSASSFVDFAAERRLIPGYALSCVNEEWDRLLLVAVTEMNEPEHIDALVDLLREWASG